MRLFVALALASCSSKSSPPPPPVEKPHAADAAVVTIDGAAQLIKSNQVLVGVTPDWERTYAELQLYRREGYTWKPEGRSWKAVVGASGTAWGIGLHGSGAPDGFAGPVKREGDGKSPAGAFAIRKSYGYAASAKSQLPYQPVDTNWKCVDDSQSAQYTRVLDARGVNKDWASAEEMRRGDDLYKWVVDIAHNPSATPGGGSCIFLHVWSGKDSNTAGCTAMDETKLVELVEKLEPDATFVLLPLKEYMALQPVWGLPAI